MSAALSSSQFGGLMRVAEHTQANVMQGNLLRVASGAARHDRANQWLFQSFAGGDHSTGERTPLPMRD